MRDRARAVCLVLGAAVVGAPAAGGEISVDGLDRLPAAEVVVLGEIHDNPQHHLNQARAIAALKPAALVFEMLTPDQAARAPADRADAAKLAAALGWADTGWPEFGMYFPIFAAAPRAAIYGADVPQPDVQRAVIQGAATVFGKGAARFGLTVPLPPQDEAAREADLYAAHCNALPADLLPGMVQVQRLRDASLARAVVTAMQDTGGPIAVITGSGHARRDQGIPSVLAQAAPQLSVLSVGQIEGPAAPVQPYDLWIVTGATPRGDPCAAFGTEARLATPRPESG